MLLLLGMTFAFNVASAKSECKWALELWTVNDVVPVNTLSFSDFEPNVTFSDGQLVITTKYFDVVFYDLSDIRKITYKYDEGSGINDIIADKSLMQFVGNDIVFTTLKAGDRICVYAANGTQVMNKVVAGNGETLLSVSGLSQGIYMINVNGKTFKILKK